jgi:hypothetical protein
MILIIIVNLIRFWFPFIFFIWSLYNLTISTYIYTTIVILHSLYLIFLDFLKPSPNPKKFNKTEIELIRQYHLFLRYPLGSKFHSIILNTFRWSAILWTPWLYWNSYWLSGSLLLVNFILLAGLSVRLDPIFFLSDAVSKGKFQFEDELENLNLLCNKIWKTATQI